MKLTAMLALTALAMGLATPARAADPWADAVVDFDLGTGGAAGFDDPAATLGSPTHTTAPASPYGGPVTPFNAPYGEGEMLSIGEGGWLTVRFDEPVTNHAMNPYGIDLLLFGNSFMLLSGFPADATTTASGFGGEGGIVELSADGSVWVEATGVEADGLYPTLGYRDITDPFPTTALVPSDFTRPVDPSIAAADFNGLTTAQIVALYDGSGGGAGVDIGAYGLSEISYVRVSNPVGSGATPEIDGFADVRPAPEPAALALVVLGAAGWISRRR
ncbi:hypothetical protein Mal64_13740 [Pseudobythopirellula maris]|uniref:PEP-CTERM protein-sorting domain-containing protein n=1 Tax=Pseudobythopirellula maris TaxID=2527991 RepID=A0A5C5ZV33_9BACT|nr:PEP-CTERM sorting domain-containing protein [Pseudobythopirellula maris]TWT90975.1 hypothetical protein Mal64_13740 [Pseudobythopirellula maris]